MGPAGEPNATTTGRRLTPVVVLLVVSVGALVPILVTAFSFRLIADDYMFTALALTKGPLGEVAYWYQDILSGVAGVFLASVFAWIVGVAPWAGGYVPYVIFVLLVVWGSMVLLARAFGLGIPAWLLMVWGLTAVPLWALSMGNLFPEHDVQSLLGMLNWITNGYRVTGPWFFVIAAALLLTSSRWRRWLRVAGSVVLGAGATLSSLNLLPDLGVYLIVIIALGLFVGRGIPGAWVDQPRQVRGSFMWMAAGILMAMGFMALSPATTNRRESQIPLDWATAPQSYLRELFNFVREMTNISNGLVFVGAAAVVIVVLSALPGVDLPRAQRWLIGVGVWSSITSVLLIVAGAAGDVINYAGVWHHWSLQQFEFIAFVAFGGALGCWFALRRPLDSARRNWALGVACLCVAASAVPTIALYHLAAAREVVWSTGVSAPVNYMADREADWLGEQWLVIKAHRE